MNNSAEHIHQYPNMMCDTDVYQTSICERDDHLLLKNNEEDVSLDNAIEKHIGKYSENDVWKNRIVDIENNSMHQEHTYNSIANACRNHSVKIMLCLLITLLLVGISVVIIIVPYYVQHSPNSVIHQNMSTIDSTEHHL